MKICFYSRTKSVGFEENFPFQALERTFQPLECTFQPPECTFQGLERKILLRGRTFSSRGEDFFIKREGFFIKEVGFPQRRGEDLATKGRNKKPPNHLSQTVRRAEISECTTFFML